MESMESSVMVRKFDFILYKIRGKEIQFSFGFPRSRSKIMLICNNVNGFFIFLQLFTGLVVGCVFNGRNF